MNVVAEVHDFDVIEDKKDEKDQVDDDDHECDDDPDVQEHIEETEVAFLDICW